MDDLPEDSPAARAAERFAKLLSVSDEAPTDPNPFDPWPLAIVESRSPATPCAEDVATAWAREWAPLYKLRQAAEARYQGPMLRSPLFKSLAARRVLELREAIDSDNDGGAVLEAVAECAAHGLVLPAWLSTAFCVRYGRVVRGQCKDWTDSEAFGKAHGHGSNIAGVRARQVHGPWAYEVACELLSECPNRPIDRVLYEDIGSRIGRGHSQAFELIREYLASNDDLYPSLDYLKSRLVEGLDLTDAMLKWVREQHEAFARQIGYQEIDDDSEGACDPPEK